MTIGNTDIIVEEVDHQEEDTISLIIIDNLTKEKKININRQRKDPSLININHQAVILIDQVLAKVVQAEQEAQKEEMEMQDILNIRQGKLQALTK